jgi:segregation and condensation protein B
MSNESIEPETGPAIASESVAAPEAEIDPVPEAEVVDGGESEGGEPGEFAPADDESDELETNGSGDPDGVPGDSKVEAPAPSAHPELAEKSLRILEALLFASAEPLGAAQLAPHVGEGADVEALLLKLAEEYKPRGVNLVRRAEKWAFRTAEDLGYLLRRETTDNRPLSRAALETLAIIAYHQPATRAEVEEVRGVATGKGTLDLLMEAGWIRMRGRRRTPGRPVTYGTTEAFLDHFGLEALADLPGLEELKGAGLLSNRLPANMQIPLPFDGPLREDEDPLDPDDIEGQDEPTE